MVFCYACGKSGHVSTYCSTRRQSRTSHKQSTKVRRKKKTTSIPRTAKKKATCSRCGQVGQCSASKCRSNRSQATIRELSTRDNSAADAYYVYSLKTEDSKIYVGMTQNPKQRMNAHFSGRGAQFTQARGVEGIYTFEEVQGGKNAALKREEDLRKRLAKYHGNHMVRGGKALNPRCADDGDSDDSDDSSGNTSDSYDSSDSEHSNASSDSFDSN